MKDRLHAFGKQKYSALDNLIFSLRKRQVTKRLPATVGTIADFGSGYDARMLIGLHDKVPTAQCIAVDTEFDSTLKDLPFLQTVTANLNEEINLPDDSVDVVISLAVLEHLDVPEMMLREAYRVLKPGGTLLLTTPGPTSKPLLEFLAFKLKVIDAHEIADHKNYFSSEDLTRMSCDAGFIEANVSAKTFLFGMNNILSCQK